MEFPEKESTILGKVKHEESEGEKSLSLDSQKFKKAFFSKHLSTAKVGSSIKINKKSFNDEQYLSSLFKNEENELLNGDLILYITEISKKVKAELAEELYKRVYPDEDIKSQKEFKNKVKLDIEKQFINQSDQKFFNDCV